MLIFTRRFTNSSSWLLPKTCHWAIKSNLTAISKRALAVTSNLRAKAIFQSSTSMSKRSVTALRKSTTRLFNWSKTAQIRICWKFASRLSPSREPKFCNSFTDLDNASSCWRTTQWCKTLWGSKQNSTSFTRAFRASLKTWIKLLSSPTSFSCRTRNLS